MTNLNDQVNQCDANRRRLEQRWQDVKSVWNDPVAWHFQKQYWTPLETQTQAVQKELERLAQVIAQAQRQVK